MKFYNGTYTNINVGIYVCIHPFILKKYKHAVLHNTKYISVRATLFAYSDTLILQIIIEQSTKKKGTCRTNSFDTCRKICFYTE